MQKKLLSLLFALLPLSLFAGSEQDFAAHFMSLYAKGTTLTCNTVSPLMMEKLLKLPEASSNDHVQELLKQIKSIRLVTDRATSATTSHLERAHKLAEKNAKRYKPWGTPSDERTIYTRRRGNTIVEVVLLTDVAGHFAIVNLTGNLSEAALRQLVEP